MWLPAPGDDALKLDIVGLGGRPLQTTLDEKKRARIHERLTELLTTVQRKVFGSVAPGRVVELYRLGAGGPGGPADEAAETPERLAPGSADKHGAPGIPTDEVVAGFFSFLGFPRLGDADAVRTAVARGVETGLFAYVTGVTGRPALGATGATGSTGAASRSGGKSRRTKSTSTPVSSSRQRRCRNRTSSPRCRSQPVAMAATTRTTRRPAEPPARLGRGAVIPKQ